MAHVDHFSVYFDSASKMEWKMLYKGPILVLFGVNLIQNVDMMIFIIMLVRHEVMYLTDTHQIDDITILTVDTDIFPH